MELTELINSIDIVEYISQYVELTQSGEEWWGLSPFKEEKTPSFSIRKEPPVFYDFSSGAGGNLFAFVKRYHNVTNSEAVEILKNYAGFDGELTGHTSRMAAVSDCKRFARPKSHEKAASGTILPDDYMSKYEKREDKLQIWEEEGISRASLDKFQVYYDAFSDRLVYPIKNLDGKIVNVGGRTVDPLWKEKKLRKYTYFFSWGTIQTLYGLSDNMKSVFQKGEIIIFEGCKSVLMADTWGIHNCAALLTSHMNPAQMKILASLGCHVVFALDKDVDVSRDKNIRKLGRYVNVEYLYDVNNLIDEKDSPVDKGREVFERLYGERRRLK